MEWKGEKIKELTKEKKMSLVRLSELTGVSRQTVNGWIKGQVPKGTHLLSLCKIFQISPDYFFSDESDSSISVPAHRTRRKTKVTPELQKDAYALAREYAIFFKNDQNPSVLPVARIRSRDENVVKEIASDLRKRSGITGSEDPLNYEHTFRLLANLGIKVIFRYFPEKLKAYAFFTKIHGHRVVFVNNSINVLDLIFPLIHEAVHAIRDEVHISDVFDSEEEDFCDDVANHTQFPDEYVNWVYKNIKGAGAAIQIITLKKFANKYRHSLYGLVKRIKSFYPDFDLKIGGADTNLKKRFPTVGKVLFKEDDPRFFVQNISILSPLFFNMLIDRLETISDRKLGELLDIESYLDIQLVRDELIKMRKVPG
ncbi:MAG: helix-turn-helix transcriptional regulator [Desulfococcaceae bacterium]|jgi:transcriptional regulator with XRE-family HTH domain|nr:helix-turn-helix transcriptional regulator [Desulfococcaceae bacterium]